MSIHTETSCAKVEIALHSMHIQIVHSPIHQGVYISKRFDTGQIGVCCNFATSEASEDIADDIADEFHAYGFKTERSITNRAVLLVS